MVSGWQYALLFWDAVEESQTLELDPNNCQWKKGGEIVIKSKLEMDFKDIGGKKFSLALDEPREGLTEVEVKAAMDEVVNRNIFFTKEGDIVETVGARIVVTEIEELQI